MFSTPIPRRSFLDSRLRSQSLQTRRVTRGIPTGDTHLGVSARAVSPAAPNRQRARSTRPTPTAL